MSKITKPVTDVGKELINGVGSVGKELINGVGTIGKDVIGGVGSVAKETIQTGKNVGKAIKKIIDPINIYWVYYSIINYFTYSFPFIIKDVGESFFNIKS